MRSPPDQDTAPLVGSYKFITRIRKRPAFQELNAQAKPLGEKAESRVYHGAPASRLARCWSPARWAAGCAGAPCKVEGPGLGSTITEQQGSIKLEWCPSEHRLTPGEPALQGIVLKELRKRLPE